MGSKSSAETFTYRAIHANDTNAKLKTDRSKAEVTVCRAHLLNR
jgi:hypothetical protein